MVNKLIKAIVIMAASAWLLTSCATLFTKSKQEVTFKGVPGTTLVDKDKNRKVAEIAPNGFATTKLKKQLKSMTLEAKKEGYKTEDFQLGTKIQGAFWANIILGGIPGMAIDAATGKMKKFETDLLDVTLSPFENAVVSEAVTPVPLLPGTVTKENPGVTDAEKAILRWFFDSDPRGARIYWRVISNVPSEVKNTNESYLTTTPLEETRSFNIPGLNVSNANNVTIEIKVTKRGYEDQIKRYNVRQAIDQQEISGFFELVPKQF